MDLGKAKAGVFLDESLANNPLRSTAIHKIRCYARGPNFSQLSGIMCLTGCVLEDCLKQVAPSPCSPMNQPDSTKSEIWIPRMVHPCQSTRALFIFALPRLGPHKECVGPKGFLHFDLCFKLSYNLATNRYLFFRMCSLCGWLKHTLSSILLVYALGQPNLNMCNWL